MAEKALNRVDYGNCKIKDKIGNTRIIISTDNLDKKTDEDFKKSYDRIQQIVYNAELSAKLRAVNFEEETAEAV